MDYSPRYTNNWQLKYQYQIKLCNELQPKLLLIGDSLVAGLSRYPAVWNEFFEPLNSINFGISGDRVENVLWRSIHLPLPPSLSKVVILCGSNNLSGSTSYDICDGLIDIGLSFRKKKSSLDIFICALLPRDEKWSVNRVYITEVNKLLKSKCKKFQLNFIEQDYGWIQENYTLNTSLYYRDNLHLVENGNSKLAKSIVCELDKVSSPLILNSNENISITYDKEFPSLSSSIALTSKINKNVKYSSVCTKKPPKCLSKSVKPVVSKHFHNVVKNVPNQHVNFSYPCSVC